MPPQIRKRLRTFRFNGVAYEAPLRPREIVTDIMRMIEPYQSCVPQKTRKMFEKGWDTFGVTNRRRRIPIRTKEIK